MNDSNQYYVTAQDKKKVIGPVTLTQITTALKDGKLKPTHIASLSLNGPWQSLEEMFASGSKNNPKTDDSSSTVKTKKRFSVFSIPRLCFRCLVFIPGLRLWCRCLFNIMVWFDTIGSIFLFAPLGLLFIWLPIRIYLGNGTGSQIGEHDAYLTLCGFISISIPYLFAFAAPILEGKSYEELRATIDPTKGKFVNEPFMEGVVNLCMGLGLAILFLGLLFGGWELSRWSSDRMMEKSRRAKEREIEIIKEGFLRAIEESK